MVLIRGGEYEVGSDVGEEDERPARRVTLDPFYLDAREVTNAEFTRFVAATGYEAEGDWRRYAGPGRETHPVVSVTWSDASAYAKWVGRRLPTEAEWEAAARGGLQGTAYPRGSELRPEDANFGALFEDEDSPRTAPVGSFPPNGYGLYDMAGNVWEWCSDYYAPDAYSRGPKRNPAGPERGAARVARGGSWNDPATSLRVSNRLEATPSLIGPVFGFRCARSAPGSG
jgi:formylglycine-generating enzyme required for sulfatase activity